MAGDGEHGYGLGGARSGPVGAEPAVVSRHMLQPCAWGGWCASTATTSWSRAVERKREGDGSATGGCGGMCAYWKKTSMLKRKTQKKPMECQYQAVQSTRICRISSR